MNHPKTRDELDATARLLVDRAGFNPDNWSVIDDTGDSDVTCDPALAMRVTMILACDAAGELERTMWDHHKAASAGRLNTREFRRDLMSIITHLVKGAGDALYCLAPGEEALNIEHDLTLLAKDPFPAEERTYGPTGTMADRMAVHSYFTFGPPRPFTREEREMFADAVAELYGREGAEH